ncbi:MAG: hypothetical protein JST51_01440 [Armatimonadetes bacterium]|nr:hypothetical protein [Armatimonadota bacterium]
MPGRVSGPAQTSGSVGGPATVPPALPTGSTVTDTFRANAGADLLAGALRTQKVTIFSSWNSIGVDGSPHVVWHSQPMFTQRGINKWQWTVNPSNKQRHVGFVPFCFNRGSGAAMAIPRTFPRTNTSFSLWDGDTQSGIISTNPDGKVTTFAAGGEAMSVAIASDGTAYPNTARFCMLFTVPFRTAALVCDPNGAYIEATAWSGAITAAKVYGAAGYITGGRTVSAFMAGYQTGVNVTADPAAYKAMTNRRVRVFTFTSDTDGNAKKTVQIALNAATGLANDNFAAPNRVSGLMCWDSDPETGIDVFGDCRWGERANNMIGNTTYRTISLRCLQAFQKDTNVGGADVLIYFNFDLVNEIAALGGGTGSGASAASNILAGFNSLVSEAAAQGVTKVYCVQATLPASGALVSGVGATEYDSARAAFNAGCGDHIAHFDLHAKYGATNTQAFIDTGYMAGTDDQDGTHFGPTWFHALSQDIINFIGFLTGTTVPTL